ncbi:MAG: SPFH domain-containing protein [Myxococcota bacterium]|nr:SPFH domain-containing protein [Myxococcota bacterium]
MEELLMSVTSAACVGIGIAVGLLAFITIAKQFLFIGRPNELLIFYGRGSTSQPLLGGGRRWRIPLLENVDRMVLNTIPIDIQVSGAYSRGGIPLEVHAVANVKISSDEKVVGNAIERFMGRDRAELQRVAKETLEGHLRGVLATLTPEEVNEDRLKFAGALVDEAEEDFEKLGISLDVLKIQAVSDDVNYLESIGRARISEVIRDAEIAESNAKAEAEQVEAESRQLGEVAVQQSQTSIIEQRNQLRQLTAELEATARSEEEMAQAAAQQARAAAEAELQDVRKELEQLRLIADVVLPAEAAQQAQALDARGQAASIEANGRAMAAVLQMLTDTWLKAGDDARDIFLIQQLEEVLKTVIERVNSMSLDEVTLIDGGDGQTLPRHVASFPATVRSVLDELRNSTGVDVTGILSGAARPEEK